MKNLRSIFHGRPANYLWYPNIFERIGRTAPFSTWTIEHGACDLNAFGQTDCQFIHFFLVFSLLRRAIPIGCELRASRVQFEALRICAWDNNLPTKRVCLQRLNDQNKIGARQLVAFAWDSVERSTQLDASSASTISLYGTGTVAAAVLTMDHGPEQDHMQWCGSNWWEISHYSHCSPSLGQIVMSVCTLHSAQVTVDEQSLIAFRIMKV